MTEIPIEKLKPNSYNPNEMSDDDFNGLKESIDSADKLSSNPLIVRPIAGTKGEYEIIDGEHRWRACRELGFKEVPCEVRDVPDLEAHSLCVTLNKNRGELDHFKLSKLFNEDYDKYSRDGKNQAWLGKQYGYKQSRISEILNIYPRLKTIDISIVSSLSNTALSLVARVRDDGFRSKLVVYIYEHGMNQDDIQKTAARCNKISDYINEKTTDPELKQRCCDKIISLGIWNPGFCAFKEAKKHIDEIVGVSDTETQEEPAVKPEPNKTEKVQESEKEPAPNQPQDPVAQEVTEKESEIDSGRIEPEIETVTEPIEESNTIVQESEVAFKCPIEKVQSKSECATARCGYWSKTHFTCYFHTFVDKRLPESTMESTPLKDYLDICPCGCNFGYDSELESWFSPQEYEGVIRKSNLMFVI